MTNPIGGDHLAAALRGRVSAAEAEATAKAAEYVSCKATNNRGNRCGLRPIPGGTVCKWHGGGAPQVRAKAALRLMDLVMPAISTLAREMVKAGSSADRQRAANSILDRAGITRNQTAEADAARELLLAKLLSAASEIDGLPEIEGAVVDEVEAVVVDDAPAPNPKKKKAKK